MKKVLIIGGLGVFIGLFLWGGYSYLSFVRETKAKAYVMLDINPSVELVINSEDKVIEFVALDSDADIITSDLDLAKLSIDEATKKIH